MDETGSPEKLVKSQNMMVYTEKQWKVRYLGNKIRER